MRYHETLLTVRFNEVDAYQVAWHGHYVAWMEVGRNDLAGRFGLDAAQLSEAGYLGPVVGLEVKYHSPARFKDEIIVRTSLRPSDTATLIFVNEIVTGTGRRLASGVTTHVLTDLNGVLQFRMPPEVEERVRAMTDWLEAEVS
ncbi:thioesterase family protein [Geobacter sp. SVR]|uniref:acyl-CoA thioesterase n=1 Tax=Geobacter sp. SVR TaxID=2495594 RepID=UPI00143EFB95|nr:thioesterase family protein [Geobacter sp. SVR]BCS54299.1 acyl-CoA thioesterase [Geobacter sp. SVR]GCF85842.1 acyl-CoA thioesterase [Geobacter sp. SVR]